MPTYEYECENCREKFDIFQQIKDEPKRLCPKCGGRLERLIGAGSGIIFKGSGFYETDYKNKTDRERPACPGADAKAPECKDCPVKKSDK